MSTFKVAMIQQRAVANDTNANLQLALKYIREAHAAGADIALFPEMWSNGYALLSGGEVEFSPPGGDVCDSLRHGFDAKCGAWLQTAITTDSEYIKSIRSCAKELHIGVAATYLSKTASKPQNTAIVIDRNGEIILEYAKVHTCDFSMEALLQSGNEFKVCEFDGVQLGVMICYDREFPESARILMLRGAEIILVPNACDMNPARTGQLNSRAFENMAGVAMANYPGENWGGSCAFSPIVFDENGRYIDNTIVSADDISERIVTAEFDMDKIRAFRKSETWGNAYRKPRAYSELISIEVKEPFIR